GLVYDSGSLLESMDKVLELADYDGLLADQAHARAEGRLLGIGLVAFTEQTAHSTQEFKLRGVPIVFGYETVRVRMDASGRAVVVEAGKLWVRGTPSRSIEIKEVCRIVYQRPERLPDGVEPMLEATRTYDAAPGTGAYTNAAHLATVEVDLQTGKSRVLTYAV